MALKFPPPSPPFIKARYQGGPQKPKAIVLHGTVSSDDRGTARNIALWWNGPTSPKSSCHYVTDPGTTIQCVGDHSVAYHCGYNQDSIGVEFCDEQTGPATRWDDKDSRAILRRAARLVAELCLAYDISPKRPSIADLKRKGPHGIYGHDDSRRAFGHTTHTDPRDFPWRKFLRMVRREMRQIRSEALAPAPTPAPEPAPAPEPRKKRTFKVLHAPLHGVSATRGEIRRALRRKGVVAIGFSEAWRKATWLGLRPGWRMITGGKKNVDERGRQVERDVVLLIRRRFRKHLEHGTRKVSDSATPLKIAPERYMSWSVDRVQGSPLAVIGIHPHAAVRDHWQSGRAKEFRRAMAHLEALIITLREEYGADLDVVVVGDLNYPDVDDDRYWTPREVFARLGMTYVVRHIDWVAHSRGLRRESAEIIDKDENGQDHPWIEVEFSRRRKS